MLKIILLGESEFCDDDGLRSLKPTKIVEKAQIDDKQ